MNPNNVVVPKIRLSEPNLDQHEIANITTAISENNLTFGIYQKLPSR